MRRVRLLAHNWVLRERLRELGSAGVFIQDMRTGLVTCALYEYKS